eukprot:m.46742 g.46742  ORF g.46742 m.46742 type:complete len:120 (-) comp20323_c0_seq1:198-557(-)
MSLGLCQVLGSMQGMPCFILRESRWRSFALVRWHGRERSVIFPLEFKANVFFSTTCVEMKLHTNWRRKKLEPKKNQKTSQDHVCSLFFFLLERNCQLETDESFLFPHSKEDTTSHRLYI